MNGSVDFNCDNDNYRNGFGQLDHEFWLGNENLAHLMAGNYQLRIDLINSRGKSFFACYENFRIPAVHNMKIGSYITGGTAGEHKCTIYPSCTVVALSVVASVSLLFHLFFIPQHKEMFSLNKERLVPSVVIKVSSAKVFRVDIRQGLPTNYLTNKLMKLEC